MSYPQWLNPPAPPEAQGRIVCNVGIFQPKTPKCSEEKRAQARAYHIANRERQNEMARMRRARARTERPSVAD